MATANEAYGPNDRYLGNPNLPNYQYKHSFTQWEYDEYQKCMMDPVYFAENYIKIVNVDKGLITFPIWDFQKNMIETFHKNRFTICKVARQSGKTTTVVAYLLHYLIFNPMVRIAILANKGSTAREILSRLELAFEYLPKFLQCGVEEWNKGSVKFNNGSLAVADSTTGSSVRGKSFNIIFLDEFAHIPNHLAVEFFESTYPTISSGQTTKVIIVSTPKGLNYFHTMWEKAIKKQSLYIPIDVHWSQVPGRDEKWKQETISNTSEQQFRQEFGTEFIGSTNTLISADKLQIMIGKDPVYQEDFVQIYEMPQANKVYCLVADVSEGLGKDYSTFSVFDITQIPYKQVMTYQNNEISPMMFPTIIYATAKKYNEAFVLIEINNIGLQVSDILHHDLEYENLIKIKNSGRNGQEVSDGFAGGIQNGLKTSKQSKRIGCTNLKTLIEADKLLVYDEHTILELKTFSENKNTWAAEDGNHDDLVMTLVNFSWLVSQKTFKTKIDSDIRKVIQEEQFNLQDTDIVPFGIIDDGRDEKYLQDEAGDLWFEDRSRTYPFDDFAWDPYGRF